MDYQNSEVSYYEQDGEWKTRKITIMGVVRSFVSQLRPGQDLTRVSLPAVLLHPFSILEVFGCRELAAIEVLLPINRENDPLERFLCVVRWYLAMIQKEEFHKKPYNPVIGENHEVWIQTPQFGRTDFCGEQVSHHPPISAFSVYNAQEKVAINVNISFGVKFGGNYVSIVTEGAATINVENHKEEYEIPKKTPDMIVKNVVFGTKKIYWSGDVSLSCAKTGYSANFSFKESGSDNTVKGGIIYTDPSTFDEHQILEVEGKLGGTIYIKGDQGKKVLLNCDTLVKPSIHYKPRSEQDALSSLNVWREVNKYIVENDMERADEIKKRIEADQRDRRAKAGSDFNSKYFIQTESAWVPRKLEEEKNAKRRPTLTSSQGSTPQLNSHPIVTMSSATATPPPAYVANRPRQASFGASGSDSDRDEGSTHAVHQPALLAQSVGPFTPPPVASHPVAQTVVTTGVPVGTSASIHSQINQYLQNQGVTTSQNTSANGTPTSMTSPTMSTSQVAPGVQPSSQPVPISPNGLVVSAPEESQRRGKRDSVSGSPKDRRDITDGNGSLSKRSLRDKFLPGRTESKELSTSSGKMKRWSSMMSPEMVTKSPSANASAVGIFPDHSEKFPVEQNIMTGWMKMRNSMKLWIHRWFVLRPGKLIYYKDDKDMLRDRCAGILRLADCEVKYRPTNKDGFSFKIFHNLHYPIYHKYGLKGETLKMALLPVSWNYCILRVGSEHERKTWMEAIIAQIEYANSTEQRAQRPEILDNPMSDEMSSDDDSVKAALSYPMRAVDEPIIDPIMGEPVIDPIMDVPVMYPSTGPVMVGQEPFYQRSVDKQMMEELLIQQKIIVKNYQKRTINSMEEWKKEIDTKLVNMERRLIGAVKQGDVKPTANGPMKTMQLSFLHIFIIALLSIIIGRYIVPF